MKKLFILLIIVFAVSATLFTSCVIRKAEPITGRAFVPEDESVANGERMYMANCQKCHPGGEGGLGPAINPNPAPGFVKRLQMRIGLGVMPSFKEHELSKKDARDISSYLRKWKHY